MSKLKTNQIDPFSGNTIGVGGAPSQPSAILQLSVTDKGFLLPRLTTAQRNSITAPATGLLIFNLDSNDVEKWTGALWLTAEGLKSLNGLVSSDQLFAFGSAGTTPNFVSAGSTHTLNIPFARTSSVTSGTIDNGEYTSFNSRLFPVKNIKYVVANDVLGPQDYNSVADALASITDATSINPYMIQLGAGIFTESQLVMKPFVTIVGGDDSTSIIKATDPTLPLIVGANNSEIKSIQLQGPTDSGVPLVYFSGTHLNSGAFSVIECAFQSASLIYKLENNSSFPTLFRTEGCRITSSSTIDAILYVDGSNSVPLFCFLENFVYRRMISPYPDHLFDVRGSNARVVLNGVLVETNSSTTHGVHVEDGVNLGLLNCVLAGLNIGLHVHNTGSGPTINTSNFAIRNSIQDILIEHPGTAGSLNGAADITKTTVDDSAPITLSMVDPTNGGTFNTGPLSLGRKVSYLTNVSDLLEGEPGMGIINGGFLMDDGGFDVIVGAGFGYAQVNAFPDHRIRRIDWPDTTITLAANQDLYVFVNSAGILTTAASIGNTTTIILIGRVVTNSTGIELIDQSPMLSRHGLNFVNRMLRDALGPIYDSGSIVSENVTPLHLDITGGAYFFSFNRYTPTGGTNITFTEYTRDGLGGFNSLSTDVVNNTDWDDNSGTPVPLTAGYFTKHTIYINCDDADEKYFVVLGQAEYSALAAVESAPLPTPPSWIKDAVTPIASIVIQEGNPNIYEFLDIRPVIGFKSSGVSASADHGNLLGLTDDDHPQYLLVNGSRNMSGNLNMGGNDITNVGLVKGVDVITHASRHLPNGADPLTTAAPTTAVGGNTANAVGSANTLARSDHQHDVATGTVSQQLPDQSSAEGTSNNLARADHVHNIPTAAPSNALGGNSTNAQGVDASFSRSDHSHEIDTGVPVSVIPGSSNAEGTSQNIARADHVHAVPVGTPVSVADANSAGAAGSFSRSDHVHSHGLQTNPAHHAVATTSVNGFLSAADKVRIDNAQQITEKSQPNGYASLDGAGKVPLSELPDTILGGLEYKGTWNANTNTPNLITISPDKGDYYVVNVAGSTSLSGITDWKIGDWAVYNGTSWDKIDNTDQVTSVFGRQGTVTAQSGDYSASQVTNVPSGTIAATNVQDALNELDLEKAIVTNSAPVSVTKAAAAVGISTEAARADHKHDISTSAPSTQTPDQSNSEGSSSSLARADHIHNIPTAAPVTVGTANTQGVASTFAKSDHVHNHGAQTDPTQHAVATGSANGFMSSTDKTKLDGVATGATNTPLSAVAPANVDKSAAAVGVSSSAARADHKHDITTATASGLTAASTNTEGSSTSLARADHTHAIATGAPSTQTPDQANAAGSSNNLARADHVHNIPADAPTTNLSPSTTNAEGVGTSFARNDHTHAVETGIVGDITTIQPDAAAAAGTAARFARADHRHAIVADVPVTLNPDAANAEGVSTSFARADHVHNVPADTAVSISTSTTNAEGASTSFARANHTHAVSITNQEVSATADATTTSATDVLMTGMTVTPAAGTYLIMFSTSVECSSDDSNIFVNLYMGGALQAHTERQATNASSFGSSANTCFPVATQALLTVNGSQAIEARWRRSAGTATAHERTLTILKVA